MAMTGPEQKRQLNKTKVQLRMKSCDNCWLNSDIMDDSDQNGMAIRWRLEYKKANRSEEWHCNPNYENNSGETAIAMAQKKKAK